MFVYINQHRHQQEDINIKEALQLSLESQKTSIHEKI